MVTRNAQKRKAKKTASNRLLLALILLLLAGLGSAVFLARRQEEREVVKEAGSSVHADHSSEYLIRDEVQYPVKRNLSTVLLIGTDSFELDTNRLVEGENRNRDLADFLVLLVLDHNEKTIRPLQLNRDTICEIPWLDERGKIGGYKSEHLTFAHTYGSGAQDSCVNTVRTVRSLVFNAPINNYLAFTMDAVPKLNDLIGGVVVTLNEDLPRLGEEYVKNAQIRLKGDAALRFVRYREDSGGSNWYRMKRHQQYLYAFADAARIAAEKDPDLTVSAFKEISPYLCTDISMDNLSKFAEQLVSYELLETLTPTGDIVPGKDFYEFHIHQDSLWDCVHEAYCVEEQ